MKVLFIKYMFVFSLLIFIACPPEGPVLGCIDNTACNYDASATEDDGSCILPDGCTDSAACNYNIEALCNNNVCFYESDALPNPIEITYLEDEISGSAGDELVAKIHLRNSSCEIMNDLIVRKIFNNQLNEDVTVYFCFNEICFPSSTDTAPNPLSLNSFEEDDYFKGYLQTDIPGIYEVTYRFYLQSNPVQNTQINITYTVN